MQTSQECGTLKFEVRPEGLASQTQCYSKHGPALHYYNKMILITPTGSAPLRVGKPFSQFRKVQKVHQNVLVFWKGNDVKRIPKALGVLEEVEFLVENELATPPDAGRVGVPKIAQRRQKQATRSSGDAA